MILLLSLAIVAWLGWYAHAVLRLAVAYKAKVLSSAVFVSGRDPAEVLETDLALDNHGPFRLLPVSIDIHARRVSAGWRWYVEGVAVDRPGLGCTLIRPALAKDRTIAYPAGISVPEKASQPTGDWPTGSEPTHQPLQPVLERAFLEPQDKPAARTRAIVVVHRGHIIAERYAPGFGPNTPIAGWSVAKTVMNALAGVLIREGRIRLSDPVPVAAWSRSGDPRRAITLEHLLRMTSGLRFSETYRDLREDVTRMLFGEPDCAAYAAAKPLHHRPGAHWQYSGGTTNILSAVIRTVVGEDAYPTFPHRALFGPLGMTTAVLETDAAGNFVGSSFIYASARDFARLGLLYLWNGVWLGRRILPEDWVEFSRRPTAQSRNGEFGAHLWLGISDFYRDPRNRVEVPADAFHAIGYEGQFISVVPSEELVVVRLGLTRRAHAWLHDQFLCDVVAAVRDAPIWGGRSRPKQIPIP